MSYFISLCEPQMCPELKVNIRNMHYSPLLLQTLQHHFWATLIEIDRRDETGNDVEKRVWWDQEIIETDWNSRPVREQPHILWTPTANALTPMALLVICSFRVLATLPITIKHNETFCNLHKMHIYLVCGQAFVVYLEIDNINLWQICAFKIYNLTSRKWRNKCGWGILRRSFPLIPPALFMTMK